MIIPLVSVCIYDNHSLTSKISISTFCYQYSDVSFVKVHKDICFSNVPKSAKIF